MEKSTLLGPEQVESVHDASLEILERVGLLVRNREARARFAAHGCRVDGQTAIVRFPRAVVEEHRRAFPATFTFHGRDPDLDRTVPDDGPLMMTGSAAPDVVDPTTGQVRRSLSADVARIAHLVNALDGYDILSIPTTADDAPPGRVGLARFYPALKHCLKPIRGSAPDLQDADDVLEMGALIAGGRDAFRARPFVTFVYCATISPLTMDVESTEKLMRFAERGIPSHGVVTPNAGVSAPLTLLATLVVANAEFLAQSVLAQICRPGTPLLYDVVPTVSDMRTGAYAPGAVETGMLCMACAQMARFYGVPSAGFVGLTNAKVNDAQAGYETGLSTMAALLGGLDMLAMGGLLDALMAFDFGKAVVDHEIALMLKRVDRGLEFSRENLALDLIADVGPGGIFADRRHTLAHMRTEAVLPEIADRRPRDQWAADGARDAHSRALEKAQEILGRDNPALISPDVDAAIRSRLQIDF
ncbi:MAG: trimethylamine methyltransferase family protein [Anaerolineae bacterium]|jgi:trimethylamine--corrinoid protein Co-methyltransferase